MEVPTDDVVVVQLAEQNVDIPFPGRGVSGYGCLRGFPRTEFNSTVCRADRWHSSHRRWSSRFSPRSGLRSVLLISG